MEVTGDTQGELNNNSRDMISQNNATLKSNCMIYLQLNAHLTKTPMSFPPEEAWLESSQDVSGKTLKFSEVPSALPQPCEMDIACGDISWGRMKIEHVHHSSSCSIGPKSLTSPHHNTAHWFVCKEKIFFPLKQAAVEIVLFNGVLFYLSLPKVTI